MSSFSSKSGKWCLQITLKGCSVVWIIRLRSCVCLSYDAVSYIPNYMVRVPHLMHVFVPWTAFPKRAYWDYACTSLSEVLQVCQSSARSHMSSFISLLCFPSPSLQRNFKMSPLSHVSWLSSLLWELDANKFDLQILTQQLNSSRGAHVPLLFSTWALSGKSVHSFKMQKFLCQKHQYHNCLVCGDLIQLLLESR